MSLQRIVLDFFARNRDKLAGNPRLGMVYVQLKKMGDATIQSVHAQADDIRQRLDQL